MGVKLVRGRGLQLSADSFLKDAGGSLDVDDFKPSVWNSFSTSCLEKQDRNVDGMSHVVRDAPIQQVGNETMAVRCHRD